MRQYTSVFTRAAAIAGMSILLAGILAPQAARARNDSEPAATNFTSGTGVSRRKSAPKDAAAGAVYAAIKRDYARARRLAIASHDPVAVKLVEWIYLRKKSKEAGAERILAFANADPRWPYARSLKAKGERLLLLSGDAARMGRYFARHKPYSVYGLAALAYARMAQGRKDEAARLARRAFRSPALDGAAERFMHARMRGLLTGADYRARLWREIMAQRTYAALNTGKLISSTHYAAAQAARALMRFRRNGPALYKRLPAAFRNAPAMRYAYARYLRKRGPLPSALYALEHAPSRSAQIDPVQWWVEKRLVARYLLALKWRKYWPRAYRLMASHGFRKPGKPAFRGEFLAGFIAMEKLGKPALALKHFLRMPKYAKTRTQKAKAWYWVGRARQATGDLAGARRAYAESARTPTVYYGLLSREKLGLGRRPLRISEGWATAQAKRDVAASELGRAVRLLARAGGDEHIGAFIWPLAHLYRDKAHLAAAAALLWDAGGPGMAVRLAKAAGAKGVDIDNYGYPLKALPRFPHRGPPLETAVLLGLIRQESEFNARAGSHAGAKGLMQMMPATARREARIMGVRYRRAWLINRPSYNLMLGRHHLSNLIQRFSGSYILGFAAYNAGGGNVRKWLRAYGDFRTGRPDPVEWVEEIPITETRKYVQKVLQGVHVYRSRLKRPALPISRDLWRGVPGWRELVLKGGHAPGKTSGKRGSGKRKAAPACKGGSGKSISDLIKSC